MQSHCLCTCGQGHPALPVIFVLVILSVEPTGCEALLLWEPQEAQG